MDSNTSILTTRFIKSDGYPTCEKCGYVWVEEMIGAGNTARSNFDDVLYCPHCGRSISEKVVRR